MPRVRAVLLRRAHWHLRTHIEDEENQNKPLCGRAGSYRMVKSVTTPVCNDCASRWFDLHPRSGLWTHVAGLEAPDELEARMDDLAADNAELREQLERLERATGEVRPRPRRLKEAQGRAVTRKQGEVDAEKKVSPLRVDRGPSKP